MNYYDKFRGTILNFFDILKSSFWFLPMLITAGAGIIASILRQFVHSTETEIPWWLSIAIPVDADGARALLSVIAGSMITVTGVVFSIAIVALSLASSQFGPRLLRNYLRDRTNQYAFGTFVANFVFSLIIMGGVRDSEIPAYGILFSILLTITSLFILIFFIHNTAVSIQASSIIASVAREASRRICSAFPDKQDSADEISEDEVSEFRDRIEKAGREIRIEKTGFIRLFDLQNILRLAEKNSLKIEILRSPGDFLISGSPILRVISAEPVPDDLAKKLRECTLTGNHRTAVQDVMFLIEQLNEIAVRSLSSGINDPKTASDCVWRQAAIMADLSSRSFPDPVLRDDDDIMRVLVKRRTFSDYLDRAYNPISSYGFVHGEVTTSIFRSLESIGSICVCREKLILVFQKVQTLENLFQDLPKENHVFDFDGIMERIEEVKKNVQQKINAALDAEKS